MPRAAVTLDQRIERFALVEARDDSVHLSYRTAGRGTPLVVLHGISGGSGSWLYQLEGLAREFRVVAWDAPGYGTSSLLATGEPSAIDYASALQRLLDALSIEHCLLVGQSLGAMIATAFARAHPARLAGLVLLGPANGYGAAEAAVRESRFRDRVAMMRSLGPDGLGETRAGNLVSSRASAETLALVAWNMRRLRPEGYEQAARLLANGDLAGDAPHYSGRVLVACGTADTVTPEAGSRQLAAQFPNWQYRALPGVGHGSYMEAPHAVNALIRRFARAVTIGPALTRNQR
jgi:pimeloyl-ACP methyl ester carboxylesterase